MIQTRHQPFLWGILGSLGIGLLFYVAQALGMQSWSAPVAFTLNKWYFVAPLVVGFGLQMGLFRAIHLKVNGGVGVMATSGGVSATSMVACCMHNLTALFPILGLSGVAIFFATYQNYVFGISLLFVTAGVLYMFNRYKKLH